jgi:hypothetical protein
MMVGIFLRIVLRIVARFGPKENPQPLAGCGFQTSGAPEGTRTPDSGSGGLRDVHFTTGALAYSSIGACELQGDAKRSPAVPM